MKQETIEEAAVKYRDLKLPDDLYDGFIAGAKEQAKRMYSEEYISEKLFNHPAMCRIRDSKSDAEARRIILELLKKK